MKERDKEFVKWTTESIKKPDIKNEYEIFDEDSQESVKHTFYSYSNIDDIQCILEEFLNKFSQYDPKILKADSPEQNTFGWVGYFVKNERENAFILKIKLSDVKNQIEKFEYINALVKNFGE